MKVCILAAGLGSRIAGFSAVSHKALLPMGNQAIISRIIDQFPMDTEYVIALGHSKQDVRDYLGIAHPALKVRFVEVENYRGPGSGPGWSLLCCRKWLAEPFLFTACDTLVTTPLPALDHNWVGVQAVEDPQSWCTLETDGSGRATRFHYKEKYGADIAFVGLAFVKDHEPFWQGLAGAAEGMGEYQVNSGLEALIGHELITHSVEWLDTGTRENYIASLAHFEKNFSFLGKSTDCTYRIGDRVIKYFPDAAVSKNRYLRAKDYQGVFCDVVERKSSFYAYRFQEGKLLSSDMCYADCHDFLHWAETSLWRPLDVVKNAFAAVCRDFYITKTLKRIEAFLQKYMPDDEPRDILINSLKCPPAVELVKRLSEEFISGGLPSTYHGDLHADNVIRTSDGFRLIDWRDSFGASVETGDRYYDLAKFLHVLDFSVEAMEAGDFSIARPQSETVRLNHKGDYVALDARDAFWDHARERGYDQKRIQIINALIYLNMAPLYERELAVYLYYLGRYQLHRYLGEHK